MRGNVCMSGQGGYYKVWRVEKKDGAETLLHPHFVFVYCSQVLFIDLCD